VNVTLFSPVSDRASLTFVVLTHRCAGGSYNGLITFYDLRRSGGGTSKETLPFSTSVIEKSHHDPVYEVFWINSKTGNQCVSVSTDGQMLWWDTRRLSEPTDSLQLCTDVKAAGQILGGSSLEYNSEAGPSKYLVGTEQGVVLMVSLYCICRCVTSSCPCVEVGWIT
jgi:dynein intermediate chain 2